MDRDIFLLKRFGSAMRVRRYECGLSQLRLAEKVGCSLNAIGEIERGQANPTLLMVYRIAFALDLSIKDLVPE